MARLDTKGWVTLAAIGLSLLFASGEAAGAQRSGRGAETTQTVPRKRSGERTGTAQKRSSTGQARGSTATSDSEPARTETGAARNSSARASQREHPSVEHKPAKHRQQARTQGSERPSYPRGHAARPGPAVRVHIDFNWPWVFRQQRRWAPRYQYRQVVFVEAGWGPRRHTSRVDVRTYYRHRLQRATPYRADVDILIDRIELYENGHYLGAVEHIPDDLGRLRATLYRDGRVSFDRNIFLVGDARAGFEMISTRHYDGFILNAYRPRHGVKVGTFDLRRQRVVPVRYSRLFDPYHFEGYVPVSLVPEDQDWLCDYGQRAASAWYYNQERDDDDGYYYGRLQDEPGNGSPYGVSSSGRSEFGRGGAFEMDPLSNTRDEEFRTDQGADIHLQRTMELKRIE